jgi:hypothetical protein
VVEIQTLHHICLTILNRFRTVMACAYKVDKKMLYTPIAF